MKILVVSTVRYRKNGIATVIENLFTTDVFAREDVSFLFPLDNEPAMVKRLTDRGFRVYTASRRAKNLPAYCRKLYELMKKERFDLIHVHGNSSTLALELLAAKRAGCAVRIAHSHSTTCRSLKLHRLLLPLFHKCCTHRIACGADAGRWLYGERDFTVVNNGVDTQRFAFDPKRRRAMRETLGIQADQTLIGHVGIINENKNQSFLLDVLDVLARRQSSHRLILVGEGPDRAAVEEKAASLGLTDRVIFAGVTDDVPAYLAACDLIAMPSIYEGLPLTLIEEQASGLHCFISDSITTEADKTGNVTFLPLSAGAEGWADAIEGYSQPCDRELASRTAIDKIKACGYDIGTEAEKLKAYYLRAVETKGE